MKRLLRLFAPRVRPGIQLVDRFWPMLLIAVLCGFLVTQVYQGPGFPYTHDGENHLARFVNYAAALRDGQIPPRFAPYLASGFGFPVFHYNYPFSNLMAAPLLWLGFHPYQAFWLMAWAYVSIGTISWWVILRRWFSRRASLAGILSFASGTYLLSTVVYRGNIGEIALFGLVPLLIANWLSWRDEVTWQSRIMIVFTATAVLLAHNVLAMITVPAIGLWSLFIVWEQKRWREWFLLWLLPAGLVAWFWIPAVMELSLVVLQQDALANQASQHALSWSQMWWSPLRFGFSQPTPLDNFGFGLGWLSFLSLFGVISVWLAHVRTKRWRQWWSKHTFEKRSSLLIGVLLIAAVLLSWEGLADIYDVIPGLAIIQFPWRWLFVVSVLLPVVVAAFWRGTGWWLRVLVVVLLVFQWRTVLTIEPVDRFQRDEAYYLTFPHTTTTRNENRPRTLESLQLGSWEPSPSVATGTAELVRVDRWTGNEHVYTLRAVTDVVIMEPTVYFPGWRTQVDGNKVDPHFSEATQGKVAYQLSARPGDPYQIRTTFGERTLWRWIGEGVTATTLVACIIWILGRQYANGNRKTR